MGKVALYEKHNPGWTLRVRSCGHYEPEQLMTGTTTYTTYVERSRMIPPLCRNCQNETVIKNLMRTYWSEKWAQLKEEMENG